MAPDPRAGVSAADGPAVVRMRGVGRRFATATGTVDALADVDVDAAEHRFTVVAGPSGSGKSTLLAIAACTDRADSGTVELRGHDVQALGRRARRGLRRADLGLLLPAPSDNLLESLDAAGNLRWAARRRNGSSLSHDDVVEMLSRVDLQDAATKRVGQLSGGEQQRLALTCVLAGAPAVVLADEPTASLDRVSAARVIDALRHAADRGATLMVASHDAHVIEAADVVVHLDHGRRVG